MLEAVLGIRGLADLGECAKAVARRTSAMGVCVWELAPTHQAHIAPVGERKLAVLASWFVSGRRAWKLSRLVEGALTGDAILAGEPRVAQLEAGREPLDWREAAMPSHAYVVPFTFKDDNGTPGEPGAVTAYFDRSPSETDRAILRDAATAFPVVFAAVADRPALLAVDMTAERLGKLDMGTSVASVEDVTAALADIAEQLAARLRCQDALIVLNQAPGREAPDWLRVSNGATTPTPEADRGLLEWVLRNGSPAWFPNLRHAEKNEGAVRARYLSVDIDVRKLTGLGAPAELVLGARQFRSEPVLSWLAVPITLGTEVLGAVRCCLAVSEPTHFSEREQWTLQLVAEVLAHFWKGWVQAGRLEGVISQVLALNSTAQVRLAHRVGLAEYNVAELLSTDANLPELLDEALQRVEELVPRATNTSIRALDRSDPHGRFLEFVCVRSAEWRKGTEAEIRARRYRRFEVDQPQATSLGQLVVRRGAPLRVDSVHEPPPGLACTPTFSSTYAMACVPIRLGDLVLGVLDLRSTNEPFSDLDIRAGESVAAQLGFYFGLAEAFLSQEKRLAEDQQMVEDLVHQLASPLRAAAGALARVDRTLRGQDETVAGITGEIAEATVTELEAASRRQARDLRVATRLVERAAKTARTAKLFRELADPRRPVACNPIAISESYLKTLIRQTLDEARLITAKDRQLRFVPRTGRIPPVWFDPDQLEQCLGQLVDNARKYAYTGTMVLVETTRSGDGGVSMTVHSTGTPLAEVDVAKYKRRGWRGPDAAFVTAEGQGIGLFIVDRVVEANGGTLVVAPAGDVTRVTVQMPRVP